MQLNNENFEFDTDPVLKTWKRAVVTENERKLFLTVQLKLSALVHIQQKHSYSAIPQYQSMIYRGLSFHLALLRGFDSRIINVYAFIEVHLLLQ